MYPVSNLYKQKINEDDREFTCNITIEHSQGTLELTDEDLSMGSLTYTEATQSGDEYTIGSTVASDISFTIFNKPEYENIQFMGATVFVSIGLFVQDAVDAHFIQPSQPSKMPGFDGNWEYIPLGRFNIDVVDRLDSTIQIKAIDNMINFDKPYNLSKLRYPATLQQIYVNICNVADVPMGTVEFPNMSYLVSNRPSDDLTLRDVLGYVAELSGTFAKCTRTGSVELRWYKPSDLELIPEHRYDFTPSDDVIQITGILATVKGEEEEDDVTYISGSEGYTIDLTENALLQGGHSTVLPNIYNNVKDTIFTPYSSNSKGNPAIQAGDIIKQIDKNGKEYTTIITKSVYKYRGKSTLDGSGLPQISKGYKGSTNRKLAEIKHKVDVEIGDKLTDLEQAMLNATELITGQMGGHVLKREGELLIMDNPDPELAVKVWRWNLGGLGYSSSGVDGIYETAMTMDGSINAKFITTGALSANIVQSGILQSQNGNSIINLNNGVLKLGNSDNNPLLYFNGTNSLTFGSGVSLNWGQIDSVPSDLAYTGDIPSDSYITAITNNTIKTTNVTATNLQVRSANITGSLSANKVETGILESQNGNSSINLDTGVLQLGSNNDDPLLYFNGWNSLILGSGVKLSWNQIDSPPNYIKSTHIDHASIESPSISGGTVTGGIIRTSESGRRLQMDSDGIESYNTSNRLHGFKLSTLGELELYNAGTEIGGIRYDTSGAGTTDEAKNRMFITTVRNYAMKLESSGNMSIEAPYIFMQGTDTDSGVRISGTLQLGDANVNGLTVSDLPVGTTSTTVARGNHTHSNYSLTSHRHDQSYIRATSTARNGQIAIWSTGIDVFDSAGNKMGTINYDS